MTVEIQFPEVIFKKAFPSTRIPGWRRAFMRMVAKMLILYDRVDTAENNPTSYNIRRAVIFGIAVGSDLQWYKRIDKAVMSRKQPKSFEALCNDECKRIYKETNRTS